MELGQKLRQARLEAGLSQRQLCGDEITRNMLSQIENGVARPSMDTLQFLAGRLGKSVSWFLEEQAVCSPNQDSMTAARTAFAAGEFAEAMKALADYQKPDPVFDWERGLLAAKCALALADQALSEGRVPYGLELLERAGEFGAATPYYGPELERQRRLLMARAGQTVDLPEEDEILLIRAERALSAKDPVRAGQYLDAAQDRSAARWMLLRGRVWLALERYAEAAECLRSAERVYPRETIPALERCCEALEDYKGAYFYACKLRELGR